MDHGAYPIQLRSPLLKLALSIRYSIIKETCEEFLDAQISENP